MSPPAAIIVGMTEASTYIVDASVMAVWRLEGGAGSLDGGPIARLRLRRDGDRIALAERPAPVVGQSCRLVLRIRTDDVVTLRNTSRVCHVTRLR